MQSVSFLKISFFCLFSALVGIVYPTKYADQLALYNSVDKYFCAHLLSITEEKIELIIEEARYRAHKNFLDEEKLLIDLKDMIDEKVLYHEKRLGNNRDNDALKAGIMSFCLGSCGLALLYMAYRKWHKPLKDELAAIYAQYGSHIKEETSNYGNTLITRISGPFSERIAEIKNKTEHFFWGECCTGIFCAIGISAPFVLYDDWKNPRHQEKYDQLCLIKKALEKALITPRKNIIFT